MCRLASFVFPMHMEHKVVLPEPDAPFIVSHAFERRMFVIMINTVR